MPNLQTCCWILNLIGHQLCLAAFFYWCVWHIWLCKSLHRMGAKKKKKKSIKWAEVLWCQPALMRDQRRTARVVREDRIVLITLNKRSEQKSMSEWSRCLICQTRTGICGHSLPKMNNSGVEKELRKIHLYNGVKRKEAWVVIANRVRLS